jgi:chromate reductase
MRFLGISGSLRKKSYNSMLLRAAAEAVPEETTMDLADISHLPPYNGDIDEAGRPDAVTAFRAQIGAADALVIASPEYNHSIPGGLKNAIDWASRGADQPFSGKPAAIMGATQGLGGTARMQLHLRDVLMFLNVHTLNRPEILVGQAQTKFDAEGRLTDEMTRKLLRQQMQELAAWTRRLHPELIAQ